MTRSRIERQNTKEEKSMELNWKSLNVNFLTKHSTFIREKSMTYYDILLAEFHYLLTLYRVKCK